MTGVVPIPIQTMPPLTCRYGLFYMSFGIVLWPSSGASAGYVDPVDNSNALGLYLICWFALSLVMWPVTWRLNVGLAVLCEYCNTAVERR